MCAQVWGVVRWIAQPGGQLITVSGRVRSGVREREGRRGRRAAGRKEKKRASEDSRETGSDVRDERLGEEVKKWTVRKTNSAEKNR